MNIKINTIKPEHSFGPCIKCGEDSDEIHDGKWLHNKCDKSMTRPHDAPLRDDDIVAFMVDGHLITREYRASNDTRVITRAHMKIMACCDLGPKWEAFAKAPAVARFKKGVSTNTLARIRE